MSLQKLFAAVGVVAVLVVLGGAAYRVFTPPVPAAAPRGVPKSISEIPITQHFSMSLGDVGPLIGTPSNPPFAITLPSDTGLALSQFTSAGGINIGFASNVEIKCDGILVWKGKIGLGASDVFITVESAPPVNFNPPIIVHPGTLLEIFLDATNSTASNRLTMAGYFLAAADLGM